MVLPVSRRVPRVPRYSGTRQGSLSRFAYGACTLYRRPFQIVRLRDRFATPRRHCRGTTSSPATPSMQRRQAYAHRRFGLFPVRSPLLGESRLLSLPPGTEMFHFPGLPRPCLCVQQEVTGHDSSRVAPFGDPRIDACLAAPRGLSQPTASFVGSWRQGIHRMPFVPWLLRCSRSLCSSQGAEDV